MAKRELQIDDIGVENLRRIGTALRHVARKNPIIGEVREFTYDPKTKKSVVRKVKIRMRDLGKALQRRLRKHMSR